RRGEGSVCEELAEAQASSRGPRDGSGVVKRCTESGEAAEAVDPLVVDLPALAAEQHVERAVPEAPSRVGELAQPHAQGSLVPGLALPVERRAAQADELAGPQPADAEGVGESGGALAQRRG